VAEVDDLAGVQGAEAMVLVNPNNPDGRCHSAAAVCNLAERMAARGGLLVVDEAFADFAPADLSAAPLLPHPALVVLRSFGKAYGLAGLRLGFALMAPERAARLRAVLGPWAVSGPAVAIGRQALADTGWRIAAKARLADDAARLDARLAEAGLDVLGGTFLFRLAQGREAPNLFARLGEAGILVRRFAERGDWLRFGLPADEAAWRQLDAALPRRSEAAAKFPLDAALPGGLEWPSGRSRQG
jgi:cobalamin biosynthetic protein CobC